jgi:hypothetical protein
MLPTGSAAVGDGQRPERRRSQRTGAKDAERPVTVVHFYQLSDPRRRMSSAPVLDLSADGLSVLTEIELAVGSSVQLFIEPVSPGGSTGGGTVGGAYRMIAEVRWVASSRPGEHLAGLVFLEVSTAEARNRNGLQRIMERYRQE